MIEPAQMGDAVHEKTAEFHWRSMALLLCLTERLREADHRISKHERQGNILTGRCTERRAGGQKGPAAIRERIGLRGRKQIQCGEREHVRRSAVPHRGPVEARHLRIPDDGDGQFRPVRSQDA